MKEQNEYRRYIPVLIKHRIEELDYNRKDDLYVIIDLIYRKEFHFKADHQNFYQFTQVSQSQFKELVLSSDGLQKALDFLVFHNILIRNNYYVMHSQAKGYKIASEYMSKTVPVEITDRNINKRIKKQFARYRENKDVSIRFAKSRYLRQFKMDVPKALASIQQNTVQDLMVFFRIHNMNYTRQDAIELLDCTERMKLVRASILLGPNRNEFLNIIHRHIFHTMRVNAINDGALYFKRNATNGRLDSNLTSLPSYLRKYLISSEPLVYLDIKNSQPFFLYALLLNEPNLDEEELSRFGQFSVDGTLYDHMVKEYQRINGRTRTRDQMKRMTYRILFSKVDSFLPQKTFFGELFPTIMAHINRSNAERHNTLAIALQTNESTCVLDKVMPALNEKGIVPFTIHDGFICKKSEAPALIEVFNSILSDMYGFVPSLHVIDLLDYEEKDEPSFWDDEFDDASEVAYFE